MSLRIPNIRVVILDSLVVKKLSFAPVAHLVEDVIDTEVFDVVFDLSEKKVNAVGAVVSTLQRMRKVLAWEGHAMQLVYSPGSPIVIHTPAMDTSLPADGTCHFPSKFTNQVLCKGLSIHLSSLRTRAALPGMELSLLIDGQPILAAVTERRSIYRV